MGWRNLRARTRPQAHPESSQDRLEALETPDSGEQSQDAQSARRLIHFPHGTWQSINPLFSAVNVGSRASRRTCSQTYLITRVIRMSATAAAVIVPVPIHVSVLLSPVLTLFFMIRRSDPSSTMRTMRGGATRPLIRAE